MPWSRLRSGKNEETIRRTRHSIIAPPFAQENHEAVTQWSAKSPSPLKTSLRAASSEDVTRSGDTMLPSATTRRVPERQRFSLLAKRHVSDPQISKTAKDHANAIIPPVPNAPSIITTAPTEPTENSLPNSSKPREQDGDDVVSTSDEGQRIHLPESEYRKRHSRSTPQLVTSHARLSRVTFDEPEKDRGTSIPPAYGDETRSSLALPVSRLSESSRSDGSLGEPVYASTTTHTLSTTTTLFRLPRRKKKKGPLFPLPVKVPPSNTSLNNTEPRQSSVNEASSENGQCMSPAQALHPSDRLTPNAVSPKPGPPSSAAVAPESPARKNSTNSSHSRSASPTRSSNLPPGKLSFSKPSPRDVHEIESPATPPLPPSGRTSTSTSRASLGVIFNMSRFRHNSEPQPSRSSSSHPPLPGTPISAGSKSQSFSLSREAVKLPQRQEGDTPAEYLQRVGEIVDASMLATMLSQSDDDFAKTALRSYMRRFKFFGDPLDMSIRKLLMIAELPKETQQIDRVLQAFANRYHECNPGVFATPDEAYFIAFSVLILHTDVFNRNNRSKMQKQDYTKNAKVQGVADEILECFYDNISYTPFIRVEDEFNINGDRSNSMKPKKPLFAKQNSDGPGRLSREPVDPYALILDNRLDSLRPSLKDVMNLEDHYTYEGKGATCDYGKQYADFFRYGILQILSSRSRPDAFLSPETVANPDVSTPGVVDIKVAKAGILWRKDSKKKKARSPWQEWGAVLTGTQLYFFRNSSWVKSLMHQHDSHSKRSKTSHITFKPPLENLKADVLMPTQDAVALRDTSYKKHKNALVFVRHGGLEEVLLADNETELNDWLAKLNYAAAFRSAGVNVRGWTTQTSRPQARNAISRIDSDQITHSSETTVSETTAGNAATGAPDPQDVGGIRTQMLTQKIDEAEERLKSLQVLLDTQLRNARHLQLLAPIQNRTREHVVLAAGGMAAKIKWTRIDTWRTRCHRDILAADRDDDAKTHTSANLPDRLAGKSVTATSRSGSITVDGLDGLKEDVFKPLQTLPSNANHKAKGSWELPPFPFQPARASLSVGTGSTVAHQNPMHVESSEPVQTQDVDIETSGVIKVSSYATQQNADIDQADPHFKSPKMDGESPSSKSRKRPVTPTPSHDGEQKLDLAESKQKARRSFQKTLRDSTQSTGPGRSKRARDSAGGSSLTEAMSPPPANEVLPRSTGSFTVHGKKASVVNLGSEWQTLAPEERLKQTKKGHAHEATMLGQQGANVLPAVNPEPMIRPLSMASQSTSTTDATAFEEAVESFALASAPVSPPGDEIDPKARM